MGPRDASCGRWARDERAGDGRLRQPHAAAVARGSLARAPPARRHPDAYLRARRWPDADRRRRRKGPSLRGEARKRGIIFDAGHGGGSFLFSQAVPALKQGFAPDVISTDLHTGSMNAGMKDILNTMSKFLNLGMSLADVIKANTVRAARRDQAAGSRTVERRRRSRHRRAQPSPRHVRVHRRVRRQTRRQPELECELTLKVGKSSGI